MRSRQDVGDVCVSCVAFAAMVLFSGCGVPRVGIDAGAPSGFVAGELDTHCTLDDGGVKIQPTSRASCHLVDPDGGAVAPEPAPVRFNAEMDDDDCKYHLTLASALDGGVERWIYVTVTSRVDGSPVVGANVMPDLFMDTHYAPMDGMMSMEGPPGTYGLMPLLFDAPGRWTVKLHIFGSCTDVAEDSPHAHASFYFDVP